MNILYTDALLEFSRCLAWWRTCKTGPKSLKCGEKLKNSKLSQVEDTGGEKENIPPNYGNIFK